MPSSLSRGVSGVKTQSNSITFEFVFAVPLPLNSSVLIEVCTTGVGQVDTLASDCKKIAFKRSGSGEVTSSPCYDSTDIIGTGAGVSLAYNALTSSVIYSLSSTPANEQIDWDTMYSVVGSLQ